MLYPPLLGLSLPMSYLTPEAKSKLSSTVRGLRDRLIADLQNAVESTYLLSIPAGRAKLREAEKERRRRLEEDYLDVNVRGEKLGKKDDPEVVRRRHLLAAIKLAAATVLNRLVVIKQMEAIELIKPKVVTGGWTSPGYREWREFAPELCRGGGDEGMGALLELLYDELAIELPGLFGTVGVTKLVPIPAVTLRAVIEALDAPELVSAWRDDTTLGWVYQYWNDPEREALDAKLNGGGKVEPHEIASKTQMFTERYMVEWLLQNSLGQQWLGICARHNWIPDVQSDGTLARLEERRSDWRSRREAGDVALDALMPIETDMEERWKYWVRPSSPRPPSPKMGEGGVRDGGGGETERWEVTDVLRVKMRDVAREFRKAPTASEGILWQSLRGKKLDGRKFRRQQPIGTFVVDFFCAAERLVVEVDGAIHDSQQDLDRQRQELLESLGLRFVRLKATDVENALEKSLDTIRQAFTPSKSVPPSPILGEGLGVRVIDRSHDLTSIRSIKILDPACGSGHFLVIAIDLLFALYREEASHRGENWSDREIVESILENNLYGVDIDPRAVQIAAAALVLKAKGLCGEASPQRLNLVASNLQIAMLAADDPALVELRSGVLDATGIPEALTNRIVQALKGADAWGSLLKIDREVDRAISEYEASLDEPEQTDLFRVSPAADRVADRAVRKDLLLENLERFLNLRTSGDDLGLRLRGEQLAAGVRFIRLVREGMYDLVIGNPPYQGASKMADAKFLAAQYPKGKADLYAAFLERGLQLVKPGGISAMLTMRNWMFIQQYSAIREYLLEHFDLQLLCDLETGAFEEVSAAQVVLSVVMSIFYKSSSDSQQSIAMQPAPGDLKSEGNIQRKRAAILAQVGRFEFRSDRFRAIKEQPIVYWWDEEFIDRYSKTPKMGDETNVRQGLASANNTRYLRLPWEVDFVDLYRQICSNSGSDFNIELNQFKWIPYVKGAEGKIWFEPLDTVILWKNSALEKQLAYDFFGAQGGGNGTPSRQHYFQAGVAFPSIGASFSARSYRFRGVFGNAGLSVFPVNVANATCLMNSELAKQVIQALNPTVNFLVGDVKRLPLFPIESADEIFAQLETAFTQHEAARETSVEFRHPGPTCWPYAQAWAQQSVDRPAGEPLPIWNPTYETATPEDWLSYSIGIALGRFENVEVRSENVEEEQNSQFPILNSQFPILYLSTYNPNHDSLNHPAAAPIHTAWATHGGKIAKSKTLRDWLRTDFFKNTHLKRYDQRPIYFPLSSTKLNFVAHISIHRWADDTLTTLLADHLIPDLTQLEGELADLLDTRHEANLKADRKTQNQADDRYNTLLQFRDELQAFIALIRQCADQGPPIAHPKDPKPETPARFIMNLDDGVMINSAALWPLLEPQSWKKPKTWWSELCTAQGKKDYDWSHLAARYFPNRVDTKCQTDPSLAVAHGCFWKYHPAKAYEWELRLQDEIAIDFKIDEHHSDQHRQDFETDHPETVLELKEKEEKRRDRKRKKATSDGENPEDDYGPLFDETPDEI